MGEIIRSFAPVVGEAPKILILGSMPGVESLERREYYANPRNDFWRLVSSALRVETPVDYEGKISMLTKHGIALWDAAATCVRPGSLDKNIEDETPNEVDALLDEEPSIVAVCFNGVKAQKIFLRHCNMRDGMQYVLLPSSSPVPRRHIKSFADKLPAWLALRGPLGMDE